LNEDLIDRLRLVRSPGIGPVTFRQLLRRFGDAAAALDAVPDLARRGGGKPPKLFDRAEAEGESPGLRSSEQGISRSDRGFIRVSWRSSKMRHRF